jgi:HEAT repeat protein
MFLMSITKINRWAQKGNINKLLDALHNENEEIRKAAALTIGQVGDSSHVEYLVSALKQESNFFVQQDLKSSISIVQNRKPMVQINLNKELEKTEINELKLSIHTTG